MVATTMTLALTSDHLEKPAAAGIYWSYLLAASIGIGLYWWIRRPASRIGGSLIAFGALVWCVSWQGSNVPLLFDLGVLAEGPSFVLTFYLFLAYPMGRLQPRAARWIMGVLVLGVLSFFLPWALFSPVIAGGGPLTRCAPTCPDNVLQIASAPGLVDAAGHAETYTALLVVIAALIVYALRFRRASRPERRALTAIAATSLLFLPAYFVYNFAAFILYADQGTLDTLQWGIVGTRILLPLGFLIALLQAGHFATTALRKLLERLAMRPTPEQWREMIAGALDDSSLRLGFWDPATADFRQADGTPLESRAGSGGGAWVPVDRNGEPVAAMVIDEALTADPELVRAASAATLVAVENGSLAGELRASRARILEASHAERRRIERDLHDSAQQRLVALRIHLELAGDRFDPAEREVLDRLGQEVDETISELREVAHGLYPQILARAGVGPALKAVARRSAMTVTVSDTMTARHAESLETAIYFCCLECLQNAAKHAGDSARVVVELSQYDGRVCFIVEDDGVGFDLASTPRGAGLTNLADRVEAVGGTLRIDARPGRGTRISGELPAAPMRH
jgi:signal transduction histidine kinase